MSNQFIYITLSNGKILLSIKSCSVCGEELDLVGMWMAGSLNLWWYLLGGRSSLLDSRRLERADLPALRCGLRKNQCADDPATTHGGTFYWLTCLTGCCQLKTLFHGDVFWKCKT